MKIFRNITVCFLAALFLGAVTACRDTKPTGSPAKEPIKITIGHAGFADLEPALTKAFPDIPFEFEYYKGPSTTEYLRSQLLHDDGGDVFFSTLKFDDAACREHLMDISGYGFVGKYESSLLNQYDVDGAIYLVPGPIIIRSMAYNKTLFEEKGWKVPTSHGELVALVKQIRAESDITPISFGAVSLGYYFTTMTTYAQTALLTNAKGQAWEKKYLSGEESCKTGFQPGIDMLQQLIDADAYDIELDADFWDDGAVSRLIRREAAMTALWGKQTQFVELIGDTEDEILLFPFYNEQGEPFLGTNVSMHIGLAKRLEKEENKEKLADALRIMEWLSTPEGMSVFNGGAAEILPLTASDNLETAEIYRELWTENLHGLKAPMLYAGYEDVLIQASEFIRDAMLRQSSLDGLVNLIDDLHMTALRAPEAAALGSVGERFTHEQSVQLIADVLLSAGLSDLAFVSDGGGSRYVDNWDGASGKLYEGNLYESNLGICMPGSNSANPPIVVMTLTGEQIRRLAENGKILYATREDPTGGKITANFDYYWSGMNVEWKDGKIGAMTFANGESAGTPIESDGVYSVAFAQNDYTAAVASLGNPVVQNIGCLDAFRAYAAAYSPLMPPENVRD